MVNSARTSSWLALVTFTPIAWSHPSGASLICSEKSCPTNGNRSGAEKEESRASARLPCRRSRCYRLRLQEPDSELEALRGSRPPELPAGKRGGWHPDSVYPRLPLTPLTPRALDFEAECTSPRALHSFLHAS